MGLLDKLTGKLRPLRMDDPEFGKMSFMAMSDNPGASYWEIKWRKSEDEDWLEISLPGTELGPDPKAREFFWKLQPRLAEFMTMLALRLTDVVKQHSDEPVPDDIYKMVRITGVGIEDPGGVWPKWELSFESMGEKSLGITIPFSGDSPQSPIVDT